MTGRPNGSGDGQREHEPRIHVKRILEAITGAALVDAARRAAPAARRLSRRCDSGVGRLPFLAEVDDGLHALGALGEHRALVVDLCKKG